MWSLFVQHSKACITTFVTTQLCHNACICKIPRLTFGTWARQSTFLLSWSTLNKRAAVDGARDLNCLRALSKAYRVVAGHNRIGHLYRENNEYVVETFIQNDIKSFMDLPWTNLQLQTLPQQMVF